MIGCRLEPEFLLAWHVWSPNNLIVNEGVTTSFNIEINYGKGTGAEFFTPY